MEIFIALTKYNTCQEGKNHYKWGLLSQLYYPPHKSVQRIYEEWDIPIYVLQSGI